MGPKVFLATALLLCGCLGTASAQKWAVNKCDFFFQRNIYTIPAFGLTNLPGNHQLTRIPLVHKSGTMVRIANTNGDATGCTFADNSGSCGGVFYFAGPYKGVGNKLTARQILPADLPRFKGKYVYLKIDNLQLNNGVWLNTNVPNRKYPEARRCVVFRVKQY